MSNLTANTRRILGESVEQINEGMDYKKLSIGRLIEIKYDLKETLENYDKIKVLADKTASATPILDLVITDIRRVESELSKVSNEIESDRFTDEEVKEAEKVYDMGTDI